MLIYNFRSGRYILCKLEFVEKTKMESLDIDPDDDDSYRSSLSMPFRSDGKFDMDGSMIRETEIREQDRYLPIANIARIMKKVLPGNAKIAKDAKESIQECVSEFISFITSEASDKCQQEKRKTINGDDLLWAMSTLGFEKYVEPLKAYLNKYRESVKGDRPEKKPPMRKDVGGPMFKQGMMPGMPIIGAYTMSDNISMLPMAAYVDNHGAMGDFDYHMSDPNNFMSSSDLGLYSEAFDAIGGDDDAQESTKDHSCNEIRNEITPLGPQSIIYPPQPPIASTNTQSLSSSSSLSSSPPLSSLQPSLSLSSSSIASTVTMQPSVTSPQDVNVMHHNLDYIPPSCN